MKKIRPQRTAPIPVSLSSKRVSLADEQMTAPYKIEWKSPLYTDCNSSKAFFQNMKAELSTIKNDFQKLIRKDGCKNEKEEQGKSSSVAAKSKCMSAYKREDRKPQKYPLQERNEQQNSHILNLEKNLPCLNEDFKHLLAKTVQLKEPYRAVPTRTISTPFDQLEITDKDAIISQQSARLLGQKDDKQKEKARQLQTTKLKESNLQLQAQLAFSKEQLNQCKEQIQNLSHQNKALTNNLLAAGAELTSKSQIVCQQQQELRLLTEQLQKSSHQGGQLHQMEHQFSKQRNFYTSKIDELMFHNQNLGGINMQLGEENQMLKQNIFGLQNFVEDCQRRTADLQSDSKRKIQYLQRDLGEYQKREDMFSREIDRLNRQLADKSQQPTTAPQITCTGQTPSNLHQYQEQMLSLKDEITHLKNQVQIQKQIHRTLSEKYEEQINNMKIEELSQQFQGKVNKLVEENGKLKNRINLCNASVQSLTEQNRSYLEQISIYEERERNVVASRKLTPNEWEQMTDTIENLGEENKRLLDEIEFHSMKTHVIQGESSAESANTGSNENLLQLASCQLAENQQLKANIKQLTVTIKLYQQQLLSLELTHSKLQEQLYLSRASTQGVTDLSHIKQRHNTLYGELQRKQEQLKSLKMVLFKVLVQKATKREEESDMDYYLREVDERFASICQK